MTLAAKEIRPPDDTKAGSAARVVEEYRVTAQGIGAEKRAMNGAGDGTRTRYLNLGKVALCQVSYSRALAVRGAPWPPAGGRKASLPQRDGPSRMWSRAARRPYPARSCHILGRHRREVDGGRQG